MNFTGGGIPNTFGRYAKRVGVTWLIELGGAGGEGAKSNMGVRSHVK